MQRIKVKSGYGKGKKGMLIREFHSEIRGEKIAHLINREVILDGESSSRTYAVQHIEIIS